ncbi:c-type cytochrome [Aridibaculum aurantiacum]|uniref:c-type cytochrome n=1 Tax=Aridibaculum aurantiacum TaxID=2810307 RepID=UPI001A977D3A|nr:c-type cytochrome [Aridibaculum aurantiacum]
MKRISISILLLLVTGSALMLSCNSQNETVAVNSKGVPMDSMVKHGEYLVTIMGCDDCHTPKVFGPKGPELDMAKRLSGHPSEIPVGQVHKEDLKTWVLFNHLTTAYVGPWGTSFAANLTSDETGVGNWTEKQFLKAMREGKYKGIENSRPMLPPMPWQNFSKATDDDLKAIFAYLKSTKPVHNLVPAPIPPTHLADADIEPK